MNTEPSSHFDFFEMFPDEKSAREYFEDKMWEGRPMCPHCGHIKITALKREGFYQCKMKMCRKYFTVRTGTAMHASKIPLRKWIFAMHLMCHSRKGVSSVQMGKALGITQKSAWFLQQRIREACVDTTDKLSGMIEVDETYMGGKERNKHARKKLRSGRGSVGKVPVFGMRERYHGHIKAFPIKSASGRTLKSMIAKHVKKDSNICTDEWKGYRGLSLRDYNHLTVNHSKGEYVNGFASTNGIESFWALLKRGYLGVYHHYSPKHMARYVNEFTFRLNHGDIKSISLGMKGRRLSYKDLIK